MHIQDGCTSSRCLSVYAPGYGYYDGATNRGGRMAKIRKMHKDASRVASSTKSDVPTAAAPADAKTPEAAAPNPPSADAPTK